MKELISINNYRLHLRKYEMIGLVTFVGLAEFLDEHSRRKDYFGPRFQSVEQERRGGVGLWTLPRAQSSCFSTWLMNGSKKSMRQELGYVSS